MESVNEIKDKFKFRKINIIGDKGYISDSIKKELKKMGINLIYVSIELRSLASLMKPTPKRSKAHLKHRYVIEHTIKTNKKNNRISLRKDRLIHTFKSFFFLSTIINLQKSITKQQLENSIR